MILAIESSCDETGVAVYDGERGYLAHKLYSQTLHSQFGGIVPELASRDHLRKLLPMLQALLAEEQLSLAQIQAIAYTAGPGLIGALLVGATFSHSLALSLGDLPLIPVHHLEGHFMAAWLTVPQQQMSFPWLGLLVSGGNSLLVESDRFGAYQVLGTTLDDAVGEAFDKVAKMMDFAYPGGVALAQLADDYANGCDSHDPSVPRIQLPIPMAHKPDLNFSFSGLKTKAGLVIRQLQAQQRWDQPHQQALAYAFQEAATESIVLKVHKALQAKKYTKLVVAGGVSANRCLRQKLQHLANRLGIELLLAKIALCTDNAAMIAAAGWEHWRRGETIQPGSILAGSRWSLGSGLAGLQAAVARQSH